MITDGITACGHHASAPRPKAMVSPKPIAGHNGKKDVRRISLMTMAGPSERVEHVDVRRHIALCQIASTARARGAARTGRQPIQSRWADLMSCRTAVPYLFSHAVSMRSQTRFAIKTDSSARACSPGS